MNWEVLGAAGEFIGGVTVIATLLYLAVQVRQARKATIASVIQSRGQLAHSFFHANETLADAFSDAFANDNLTSAQRALLGQNFNRTIAYTHTLWAQLDLGVIEPKYFPRPENMIRVLFRSRPELYKTLWEGLKVSYPPEFIEWVEAIVQELDGDA